MPSRPLLIAAALALAAAGCVPSGGSVQRVRAAGGEGPLAAQGIRVLAQPPPEGVSPDQLTRQFLLACADPDDDFAVARSFLAPVERKRWDPRAGVTVYAGDPADLQLTTQGDRITVIGQRVATIRDGDYALADGPAEEQAERSFRLVRVDGEWRLADVPDGLLLSASLLFAFKPVDLYFFAPDLRRLVPDRVFLLASRRDLPNNAMRALVAGPSPSLRAGVRSLIPDGARLASPATVAGGVLTVDLDLRGGRTDRAAMVAQVLWTAAQLPEVSGVRMRIDGAAYAPGGVPVLSANPDALGYDPDALPAVSPAYYVVPGAARAELRSTDGDRWAFRGPRGALRHPAVGLDRSLAGLDCPAGRCSALYVGRVGDPRLHRRLAVSGTLTPPSWDAVGAAVWSVEHAPGAPPRIWAVPTTGRPYVVPAPELTGGRVVALRLARDGARVAMVVRRGGAATLLVGVVVHDDGAVHVEHLNPVAPALAGAVDVAWGDAGRVVVLARLARVSGSLISPYRVRVDGSEAPQPIVGTALGGQPLSLATAPGKPPLVATRTPAGQVRVSQLQNQTWSPLATGADPGYPG